MNNTIITLLTMLRFSGTDTATIIRQIIRIKKIVNSSDFKTIITGDKSIKIGQHSYRLVSKYNYWSLMSQIEYEIHIKNNKTLGELYQYVKSL